jgi:hypothetical protein
LGHKSASRLPIIKSNISTLSLIIFLSSVLLIGIGSTAHTYAQGQPSEQFPQNIIAFSNTDTTPHALELKAIQQGDAEPRIVSGFNLDITNTITAQINSQILLFVTDSSVQIIEAKVRTTLDQLIDLVPSTQANAFSLANLPVGVYTLDVITQKGNAKAAYEGILALGQEPTDPQTQTIIDRQIIREERDNGDNGDNCDY